MPLVGIHGYVFCHRILVEKTFNSKNDIWEITNKPHDNMVRDGDEPFGLSQSDDGKTPQLVIIISGTEQIGNDDNANFKQSDIPVILQKYYK